VTAPEAPPGPERLGLRVLRPLLRALPHGFGGLLPVLELLRQELGEVFRLDLPGFRAVVVAGPEAIRQVLTGPPDVYRWRPEADPVARLMGRGVLVTDGAEHERLRRILEPANRRSYLEDRCRELWRLVDRLVDGWQSGCCRDMLVEMRRITLTAFAHVYFSHDPGPELAELWEPVLSAVSYIGPGPWLVLGAAEPPPGAAHLRSYLTALIRRRRQASDPPDDLLTQVVRAVPDDGLAADQLLTMLIAGHDTCTAALSWSLYLLGLHPRWLNLVKAEVRETLGREPPEPGNIDGLVWLDRVVREALRLYPPIHVGMRLAGSTVTLQGYRIPAGTRIMLSYYLVHRHGNWWPEPLAFRPERWAHFQARPFTYLPFGGGHRGCIGATFAWLQTRLVLARLLQRWDLRLTQERVRAHMGATLEPRPGVLMEVALR
jgi:cytochrome P450